MRKVEKTTTPYEKIEIEATKNTAEQQIKFLMPNMHHLQFLLTISINLQPLQK